MCINKFTFFLAFICPRAVEIMLSELGRSYAGNWTRSNQGKRYNNTYVYYYIMYFIRGAQWKCVKQVIELVCVQKVRERKRKRKK